MFDPDQLHSAFRRAELDTLHAFDQHLTNTATTLGHERCILCYLYERLNYWLASIGEEVIAPAAVQLQTMRLTLPPDEMRRIARKLSSALETSPDQPLTLEFELDNIRLETKSGISL